MRYFFGREMQPTANDKKHYCERQKQRHAGGKQLPDTDLNKLWRQTEVPEKPLLVPACANVT